MSEATMLHEHGTDFARLKPVNVIQAAQADLKLIARKRDDHSNVDPYAMYSFARQHVQRARSVAHLISLAYFSPEIAAQSTKHSTMIVYGDREVLRLALLDLLQAGEVPA